MMLLFKPSSTLAKRSKQRPYQSFSESVLTDSIETAETFIRKWISPDLSTTASCSLSSIFSNATRVGGRRFVDVINSLQYAIQGVVLVNPDSQKLSRAHNLVTISMKHLEKEFYRILKSNRRNLDPQSISRNKALSSKSCNPRNTASIYTDVPESEDVDVMTDLKLIADCMISSGYENECVKIYKKIRKSIMVESLSKLGFEDLSFGKIQKLEWDCMEKNIKKWLEATKVLISNIFYGERILCDNVFSPSVTIAESCFTEITLDSALTLFIFPVSVARCRKTVEKIFVTLDVYQTISQLLPKINEIFSYESMAPVRLQAADSLKNLSEGINSMVAEFEASITKESSKSVIPGGGVHQLTRYVMNYIVFLADYEECLDGVLTESTLPFPEDYFGSNDEHNNRGGARESSSSTSPVIARFAWLILVLLCKIDTKSRIYTDMALSYLFLANNLDYVISKVRSSNLKVVLGDEWLMNHQGKVAQYLEKYEKLAWGEVIASLSDSDKELLEEHVAKERLNRFNELFEEAVKKQSEWVVPDSKLRNGLKDSVTKKLTTATLLFNKKYQVENWEDIVRLTPEDMGKYLSDLLGSGRSCNVVPSFKPSDSGRSLNNSPTESGR